MSSRRLLVYLDGLPNDSWYKQSAAKFVEEFQIELERQYANDVHNMIFAQLTGQIMEVADGQD